MFRKVLQVNRTAMATSNSDHEGITFVTDNYSAFLRKPGVHENFHFVQEFLRTSVIGHALTQLQEVCGKVVLAIWNYATFHPESTNVAPRITFLHDGKTLIITPSVVYNALNIPNKNGYTLAFNEDLIGDFFVDIGYDNYMSKVRLGLLK